MIPKYPDVLNYVPNVLLKKRKLEQLVEEVNDYAHCHGLVMRLSDNKDKSDVCQSAPLALFPSPFPVKLYRQALDVQNIMSELYFRLAWDHDFLIEAHKDVIKSDEFTRKMVEVYEKVWNDGVPQTKTLVTQRADYMCNVARNPEGELKQIEVNNIAVSMGGLVQRITKWHKKILFELMGKEYSKQILQNEPIETLAEGLYQAWLSMNDPDAAILVVVEEFNQNQLDQRFIEYKLDELSNNEIKIIRATLGQCSERLLLKNKQLYIDMETRVSLVYFRAGYSPSNYPTDNEWDARLKIEQSDAIKCPWIGLQLANTKKVQQVLDKPNIVEKYFPDNPEKAQTIRSTFAGLWGLEKEDEITKNIIHDAILNSDKYVLKPQLEGGGGNYYGEDIPKKLKTMSPDELAAHILMEKIQPLVTKNILIKAFQPPSVINVVSELGIYGYLFGDNLEIKKIKSHGHILRTKPEKENEGGVAVGISVIDSPFLYN